MKPEPIVNGRVNKASQLRAWIGQDIEWEGPSDGRGWSRKYVGRLEEIRGRNVRVDNDFRWFPQMFNIRLRDKTLQHIAENT